MTDVERKAVISGIGQSEVGRRLGRSDLDLTLDASLEAIADAGHTPADIDGVATIGDTPIPDVVAALGLPCR